MAIDPRQIELTPEQQQALADASERSGRPWSEVFEEALRRYRLSSEPPAVGRGHETFYDSMRDVIGTVTNAPPDLSTNPKHMEGFGSDRRANAG